MPHASVKAATTMQRLDRWLAQATGASRSEVREWLRAARVRVEGRGVVRDPSVKIPQDAHVAVDGDWIESPGPVTIMLHKPAGVVSATRDASLPTVLGLINAPFAGRLRIVGRLDRDATGLLLLTDDGDYLHRVAKPGGAWKRYRVTLASPLTDAMADALRAGVALRDDPVPARACALDCCVLDSSYGVTIGGGESLNDIAEIQQRRVWQIAIDEGRYHQVKRMFAAVGAHVSRLHREAIGALELDKELVAGRWRRLSDAERSKALTQIR
ncbi:MAG: pseudouridine synthase [Thioalkalivibrionaceae bacterium]